jgi:hypothetical protein
MATTKEVLEMLLPTGGWIITGDDFDSIVWVDNRPKCTKAQFTAGFAQYDAWKAEQDATKATARQAVLDRLGITSEEAQLILGGSN